MWSVRRFMLGFAVTAALALSATSAFAHAHLETSMPAANAIVASPSMIMLHFTEALEPRFSGFEVTDARGHAVNAPSHMDPSDSALLTATPAPALAPGVYHVNWHIVARDGHRMRGTFDFTVRA